MTIENYLIELSKSYTPNTLLDIGAHHGNFSVFCKRLWKDVDLLMLEGNENNEEILDRLPFSHCIVLLSDCKKEVTLHLNPKNPTCTGTSYMKENTKYYDNSIKVEKETHTLDEVIAEVGKTFDIIKIDTQGSELDIIRGGLNTIQKASYIIMEVAILQYNEGAPLFDEVVEYMKEIGFTNHHIVAENVWRDGDTDNLKDGELLQVDVVFSKGEE
jgi:FkbM family methyltransferase